MLFENFSGVFILNFIKKRQKTEEFLVFGFKFGGKDDSDFFIQTLKIFFQNEAGADTVKIQRARCYNKDGSGILNIF